MERHVKQITNLMSRAKINDESVFHELYPTLNFNEHAYYMTPEYNKACDVFHDCPYYKERIIQTSMLTEKMKEPASAIEDEEMRGLFMEMLGYAPYTGTVCLDAKRDPDRVDMMKVFLDIAGRFVTINGPSPGWKYSDTDNFLKLEYNNYN